MRKLFYLCALLTVSCAIAATSEINTTGNTETSATSQQKRKGYNRRDTSRYNHVDSIRPRSDGYNRDSLRRARR